MTDVVVNGWKVTKGEMNRKVMTTSMLVCMHLAVTPDEKVWQLWQTVLWKWLALSIL